MEQSTHTLTPKPYMRCNYNKKQVFKSPLERCTRTMKRRWSGELCDENRVNNRNDMTSLHSCIRLCWLMHDMTTHDAMERNGENSRISSPSSFFSPLQHIAFKHCRSKINNNKNEEKQVQTICLFLVSYCTM